MLIRGALAAALAAVAFGKPEFPNRLPNGRASTDPSSGISCLHLGHEGCVAGAPRNQFGLDFKAIGDLAWTPELCATDSDGDGLTNGQELGDPCCLWTPDNTSPPGFRVDNLSHPGDASSTATAVPECPTDATEPPPSEPPATDAPATDAPATEPPMTKPPVEEPLATEPTVKEPPATKPPVAETPATTIAVTQASATKVSTEPAPLSDDAPSTKRSAPKKKKKDSDSSPKNPARPPADKCAEYGMPCAKADAVCCEDDHICTDAPWEGKGEQRCLPKPPKCYEDEARCAGAPNKEFVPYASCCTDAYQCVDDSSRGWGRFCLPVSVDYEYDGESSPEVSDDGIY